MTDRTETPVTGPNAASLVGGIIFALAVAALIYLNLSGASLDAQAAAAGFGWAGALIALKPLVKPEKYSALYFAFGVMAFMIFFLHESYEYTGKVRLFPLIIGWTGTLLSALDIISLTDSRIAAAINTVLCGGVERAPAVKNPVGKEVAAVAAMVGGVVLIYVFGYLVASAVFVFLWMRFWGKKPLLQSLYGGVGTVLFIWIVFQELMQFQLYDGKVFQWLLG